MSGIQNIGMQAPQSLTRENKRSKLQRIVIDDNDSLNAYKNMQKNQIAQVKQYEKESVLVNSIKAQEFEQNEVLRKKTANQQILNYWREQENMKLNTKRAEKEVALQNADKYIFLYLIK